MLPMLEREEKSALRMIKRYFQGRPLPHGNRTRHIALAYVLRFRSVKTGKITVPPVTSSLGGSSNTQFFA